MNPISDNIKAILREVNNIWDFVKGLIFQITHLADDTDVEGTISGIESDIVLGGSKLWILICSVMIACIGLDVNSPAVIIGAMLISPLMGPILGIGLSVGLNDRSKLTLSVINFTVATVLSLLVSTLYFVVTPLGELTDEMRARTAPTILDAFVALFGGLAGIIAGSRTNKTNAIPGVAIATALMPPLCTAGFGLATGRIDTVFWGAFYLFFINAVLISLSTYFIVRILNFPVVSVLDKNVARKAKIWVYSFLVLLLLPSIYFLVGTLRTAAQKSKINDFISSCIHADIDRGVQWSSVETDSLFTLKVYYFGDYINKDSINVLTEKLKNDMQDDVIHNTISYLDHKIFGSSENGIFMKLARIPHRFSLELTPTDAPPDEEKERIVNELADLNSKIVVLQQKQDKDLVMKEGLIDSLTSDINHLKSDSIPFNEIKREIKAFYPELDEFVISKAQRTTFDSLVDNEYYTVILKWNAKVYRNRDKKDKQTRLREFLKVKLKADTVGVISY